MEYFVEYSDFEKRSLYREYDSSTRLGNLRKDICRFKIDSHWQTPIFVKSVITSINISADCFGYTRFLRDIPRFMLILYALCRKSQWDTYRLYSTHFERGIYIIIAIFIEKEIHFTMQTVFYFFLSFSYLANCNN